MVDELFSTAGVLLRRDAVAAGFDDNHLARLTRTGQLTRIRQGAYARGDEWGGLDHRGRHIMLCDAVARQYGDAVAFTHDSAVVLSGGPDYGLDLRRVHLTHLDPRGGRRNLAGVVHHEGTCCATDVTRTCGRWLSAGARTVLDVAALRGVEAGVVVADDFLRRRLTSQDELRVQSQQRREWPGSIAERLVVARSDGRAESVGETLGRELFRKRGLPIPVSQFEVYFPDGRLAGRTDWAWPAHGVLGEFDGKQKYLRLRRPGESIEEAVLREKRREDLLRELTGWRFVRLIWVDLFRSDRTAARVRAALSSRAA